MRVLKLVLLVFALAVLAGAGRSALGDWDEGDPDKMHYPQLPDSSGWDVCICCQHVADDFRCMEEGPISDIHFWISWLEDDPGTTDINDWTILICDDKPGEPNTVLWSWNGQGTVKVRPYGTGEQGWVCPSSGLLQPNDHMTYYQVNITNIEEPLVQEQGKIYWLVIRSDIVQTPPAVGWKTSTNEPPGPIFGAPALWVDSNAQWRPVNTSAVEQQLHDMAFVITGGVSQVEREYGDAPEDAVAYPSTGTVGWFPTCKTVGPAGSYVEHNNFGAWLGPAFEFETDGDAGLCPPGVCFPPYDADECYADGDAGLLFPEPYTITAAGGVVTPCPPYNGTALGYECQTAVWGVDIDVNVHNHMPSDVNGYVNVLFDWTGNGLWGETANCGAMGAPEHVLVNFEVPNPYDGSLSALGPPSFVIGPNDGYVWARISITEKPVMPPWDGSGIFEDGESEDYLIRVDEMQVDELDFGDAPDGPYPTLLPNGARHIIQPRIYLGSGVDPEADGQPDAAATGDDLDGNDDEDGVVFTSPLAPGMWAKVDVNANAIGFLDAWVDFAGDGSWAQPVDQIFASKPLVVGINSLSFWVPFGAQPGTTFARFRFSTAGGLSYDGQAPDGEVEDYMVDIEENPTIKWIQFPDTSPNGINIKVDGGRWMADDFECTSYGLITDVHLWGSWNYDEIGEIVNLHLSFHSDDPVGPDGHDPDNTYSKPDELLWQRDFDIGQFEMYGVMHDASSEGEYWWDPVNGDLIPGGDHNIWRIDVYIDPCDAFRQDGDPCEPVIYWLDVKVTTDSGEFGWKTRRYPEHYMDDAVYHWGELPFDWKELRYPSGHPYHEYENNSIDMAFALTGQDLKRPVEHLKWQQPPIPLDALAEPPTYCGWNQASWTQDPDQWYLNLTSVADDFRCLGTMPVKSIHWWGSYLGWDYEELPLEQPIAWWFRFWSNVAPVPGADPEYSHPGDILHEVMVPATDVETEWVGWDQFPEMPPEACFQHNVEFKPDDYFWQMDYNDLTEDGIYWLNIMAIYPDDVTDIVNPWGWKTRPVSWMDDAVTYECRPVGPDQVECRFWPLEDPLYEESYDVAFELDTDPCYIKWEQPFEGLRHWRHYEDVNSWALEDDSGVITSNQVVADDWLCQKNTPVTAIVWWGSYKDWYIGGCPPGGRVPRVPDYFLIQIWTDTPVDPIDPASFSHPRESIWSFQADKYDEVFVGYDKHPHGTPSEPVFRYSVKLPYSAWFKQETEGTIYWLSILAVYKGQVPPDFPWGWTNHPYEFQDYAVRGWWWGPVDWWWDPLYDQTDRGEDMSFMLFTELYPDCWNYPTQCHADSDGDGDVDTVDWPYFRDGFGNSYPNPAYEPCGDYDRDGDIDTVDWPQFRDNFGKIPAADCPPGDLNGIYK